MIISISGKAGSGKDTVGKIIQHLTSEWQDDEFKDSDMLSLRSDWQIKKYSDKLKDIVCILIGCTREQLEDQEFKETPLGKEWTKYLLSYASYSRISYSSDPEWNEEIFLSKEEALNSLNGNLEVASSTVNVDKIEMTPRKLLQLIGTEGGRDLIHPDIWVNALYSDYRPLSYEKDSEGRIETVEEKWIITDSRFPNDVRRTREMGGILIRVNRAECEGRENEHVSETALDNYTDWDHVIENNGAIEDLIESVKNILIKEGILNGKGIL